MKMIDLIQRIITFISIIIFVVPTFDAQSQNLIKRKVLFDDFDYNSIDYPAEGDSSGSIFGKNPWVTERGIIYTPAWRRFNRENHDFGKHASINIEDYGFSLKMNKGYKRNSRHPMIVSGFYFTEGTNAAKVRFNNIIYDTQFIQAFWLTSPLYFRFQRESEILNYWSEMDFEFSNYLTSEDILTVQTGCNNTNGKNSIYTQLDCTCKDKNNIISIPRCNGNYNGLPILTGKWYICLFNLDSVSRTLKFSMLCDSLDKPGAEIWAGKSGNPNNWGEQYMINNYFPEYTLTTVFSLHIGGKSEEALSNSIMNVDWFYYSPVTNLNFDEIKKDIDIIRTSGIRRINTSGLETFSEAMSEEPGIIYIEGPDSVTACLSYTWKLKSNYKRHATFDMEFRYRFINDDGPEEWVSEYKPDITLTPRSYHRSLEIISNAFDFWGQYTTKDTMLVYVNQNGCETEKKKFIVSEPYPNPALLTVQCNYELLESFDVSISIFDMLGNKIKTLADKHQDRGHYTVIFDAASCSTGLYFCVYKIGSNIISKKIEVYKGRW